MKVQLRALDSCASSAHLRFHQVWEKAVIGLATVLAVALDIGVIACDAPTISGFRHGLDDPAQSHLRLWSHSRTNQSAREIHHDSPPVSLPVEWESTKPQPGRYVLVTS